MIGNTHFDPVWLWRWDEALPSITATFRSALERMKENPNFCYSFSAPAVFEWIEKTDIKLFEEIQKRVAEGRWELCEGWWLQADCNAPGGESYIRQGLYAQDYLKSRFGKTSYTVFNIDSFGHNMQLPQILRECGLKNYVFWRPNEAHKELPSPLFDWVGLDGSSVRCYRIGGKGGEIFVEDIEKETFNKIFDENTEENLMVVFGVTDHGGAPTKQQMSVIDRLAETRRDYNISYGTVSGFFDTAKPEVSVRDELQTKFIGPCCNYTPIKQDNRRAETALLNCEAAGVIAYNLIDREYPQAEIKQCWKDVMFNQFHDILGGACISSAYRDARDLHGRAIQTASEHTHYALQSVTNMIAMPGKNPDNAWNLVVWNLNSFPLDAPIEAEVQWAWEFPWYNGGITLTDADGMDYPTQIITEECVVPSFRSRFVFRAEIPAGGYKCFIVRQTEKSAASSRRFKLSKAAYGGFDLIDTQSGKTLKRIFAPNVRADECDTWGFNKTVFETERQELLLESFEIIEDGLLRTTYKAVYGYNKSTFTMLFKVYDDRIVCEYRCLWNEERKTLKLGFDSDNCVSSIPFGFIRREPSEYEMPMAQWIDGNGFSLGTPSAFSYDYDGKQIGITLLRNALFGDLRTAPLDANREYTYMGQGETTGVIQLCFDNGKHAAAALNNPPIIIPESNHNGTFPTEKSFFKCDGAYLSAVKKSEINDDTILRIVEENGEDTIAKVTIGDCEFSVPLKPFEIRTMAFDGTKIHKVNMLES